MRPLLLEYDYHDLAAKLRRKYPDPVHATQTIEQDTLVIAPDGKIIALLLCGVIPKELYKSAHEYWKKVKGLPSNRATAMGTESLHRSTNKDGVPSPQSGVNASVLGVLKKRGVRQGILGWDDRRGELDIGIADCFQIRQRVSLITLPWLSPAQTKSGDGTGNWRAGD
jgi:hypothetical protein